MSGEKDFSFAEMCISKHIVVISVHFRTVHPSIRMSVYPYVHLVRRRYMIAGYAGGAVHSVNHTDVKIAVHTTEHIAE